MTEFGNMDLIEKREEDEGGNVKIKLPGVVKGDMAARSFKPEVRVYDISFSPTGTYLLKNPYRRIEPNKIHHFLFL